MLESFHHAVMLDSGLALALVILMGASALALLPWSTRDVRRMDRAAKVLVQRLGALTAPAEPEDDRLDYPTAAW